LSLVFHEIHLVSGVVSMLVIEYKDPQFYTERYIYIYIYTQYILFFCMHPYLKCIIPPDYHNFDVLNVAFSERRTLGFILWVVMLFIQPILSTGNLISEASRVRKLHTLEYPGMG